MTIRPATPAGLDFATIRNIAHRTWPSTFASILSSAQITFMLDMMYSDAALLDQTIKKGHRFLIALDDQNTPVGYAGYEFHYRPATTKLHKLYVLPSRHGKGFGKALMAAVEDAARPTGDTTLRLDVNRHNAATGFYEHTGFTKVDTAITDIGSGFVMDDFIYERPIPVG